MTVKEILTAGYGDYEAVAREVTCGDSELWSEAELDFELMEPLYVYCVHYHGGANSAEYRLLSAILAPGMYRPAASVGRDETREEWDGYGFYPWLEEHGIAGMPDSAAA